MAYELERLKTQSGEALISAEELRRRIERLLRQEGPRFRRLWAYHRNPMRVSGIKTGESGSDRPYRQAQEWGLPWRITGVKSIREPFEGEAVGDVARKEVVIENDIGWRIETMVDYLFGKPLVIHSAAPDEHRRQVVDSLVRAILAHNGGVLFFQQLALLGAVYGFVDVLVKLDVSSLSEEEGGSNVLHAGTGQRLDGAAGGVQDLGQPPASRDAGIEATDSAALSNGSVGGAPLDGIAAAGDPSEAGTAPAAEQLASPTAGATAPSIPPARNDQTDTGASKNSLDALIQRVARMVRLEIVEPARALPVLSATDYRVVEGYVQCYELKRGPRPRGAARAMAKGRWWERLLRSAEGWLSWSGGPGGDYGAGRDMVVVAEVATPRMWQRYEDEVLVAEGDNSLGQIPLVHIQNTSMPFEYAGTSDVEGLIPLQDELNTRLSDRANRIALQSFKMYLGKGIERFTEMPVAPGRMWMAENEKADIIEFGGDDNCPSESLHIADMREAMDKASGVSPIAAGAIKNRIGRLTSAAALRLTLISLLAKTDKKRTTYGMGIQRMIELALDWLDRAGVFATAPEERRVELHWPSPLPENDVEKLQEAEIKTRLGVSREVVLRELGY